MADNSQAITQSLIARLMLQRSSVVWASWLFGLGALGWFAVGMKTTFALFLGFIAVVVAHLMAELIALGGGVIGASARLVRLMAGMIVKWLVILTVLIVSIILWRLPVVALLVGAISGLVVQFAHLMKLAR